MKEKYTNYNRNIYRAITILIFTLYLLLNSFTLGFCEANKVVDEDSVTIGVLSFKSKEETMDKWTSLADYLSESIHNTKFEIMPLFYTEFEKAIIDKEIDYIFTNPAHYIALGEKFQISGAIATLTELYEDKPQLGFGGVIFVRNTAGSPRSLKELEGKTVSAVNIDSLGGYLASAYELKKAGVDLETQVNFIFTGMPHCKSVHMVMDAEVDAGFARTGVIENMIEAGEIKEDDIRILNEQEIEGFDQYISTDIYPEWPFIALPHIKPQQAQRVAASLFLMDEYIKYTECIGISGFTIPARYIKVEMLMMDLHISPFDKDEPITLWQIWKKYYFKILIFLGLVIIIFLYAINRARMSQILTEKNCELHELTKELQSMNENLTVISNRDSLTGLYNRRYFELFLEERVHGVQEGIDFMSLCILDIDNFKYYNDRYGHQMGDRVLAEVANALQEQIENPLDIVARYAGDEFIVILHDINLVGLKRIAHNIVQAINKLDIIVPAKNNENLKITISLGATTTSIPCDDCEEVFHIADKALFQAKNQGKNCCVICEGNVNEE